MSDHAWKDTMQRCPFCGYHGPRVHERPMAKPRQIWIQCDSCGARGPYSSSADIAEWQWNDRHEPQSEVEVEKEAATLSYAVDLEVHRQKVLEGKIRCAKLSLNAIMEHKETLPPMVVSSVEQALWALGARTPEAK